jgi:hypothetical protein
VGGLVVMNDVRGDVESYILDAAVTATAGDVVVKAVEAATLTATDDSVVVSDGGSIFGSGESVAVNAVISTNVVLSESDAYIENSDVKTTTSGDVRVDASNTSTLSATIESETDSKQASIGITLAFNSIGWETQNFLFSTAEAVVGGEFGTKDPAHVEATIRNSEVTAAGEVILVATSNATIDSEVTTSATSINASLGGSTAISIGANVALNKVSTDAAARIEGGSVVESLGGDIGLSAADTSTIGADVDAPTLGVALGSGSTIPVTVGLSVARNEIDNDVEASIQGSGSAAAPVRANAGALELSATQDATIDATSAASAVGVAVSVGKAIPISAGGALAFNEILGSTRAFAAGSTVEAGQVDLDASNDSNITSLVDAAATAVAVGGGTSPAFAIGASVALNEIGEDGTPLEVVAFVENSDVTAAGNVTLSAGSTATIDARVDAASVAVSAAAGTSFSPAVAGVFTTNELHTSVKAYVLGAGGDDQIESTSGNVILTAEDASTVTSYAGAAAVAGAFSLAGSAAPIALGGSIALNDIDSEVAAYVDAARVVTGQGQLELDAISTATIDAHVDSTSIAIGATPKTSVAVSGGLSWSNNQILTRTNAYLKKADVDAQGSVLIDAENSSRVTSDVLGAAGSLSASLGGGSGIGASVGAAIATNRIGFEGDTSDPEAATAANAAQVRAYVEDSSIDTEGDLVATATSSQTIVSSVDAISVAIGLSVEGSSFTGSGAGVRSENEIASEVKAFIDGDGPTGIEADSISLLADDRSSITSSAFAGAVAGAFTGKFAASAAVGVSVSLNHIENVVEASIRNADDGVTTTVGDISVRAKEHSTIASDATAAAIALGGSLSKAVSLSGGGADSRNEILTDTNAFVADSVLSSADDVRIEASNTSTIRADVLGVAGSVAIGADLGVGVAIGASVARNEIGADGDFVQVRAYAQRSEITTTGDLIATALSEQTIDAAVTAAAVAIAASSTSALGASGAGVDVENEIFTQVEAFVDGDGANGISADAISLSAEDLSEITAVALAGAVAGAVGGTTGGAAGIGVSRARNRIEEEVEAYIQNADTGVTTTGGAITLTANAAATITSEATAAALALGGGGTTGIALAGGGADARNEIDADVNAFVDASVLDSAGAVTLAASNASAIDAQVAAVAASVAIGGTTGVGASIGASIARNEIGSADDPSQIQAYVKNSSVDAVGALSATATSTQTITAGVDAVSVALSGGGSTGIALGGAGTDVQNHIRSHVKAGIEGSGTDGIAAGSIDLAASDTSTITSSALAGAVGGSFARPTSGAPATWRPRAAPSASAPARTPRSGPRAEQRRSRWQEAARPAWAWRAAAPRRRTSSSRRPTPISTTARF